MRTALSQGLTSTPQQSLVVDIGRRVAGDKSLVCIIATEHRSLKVPILLQEHLKMAVILVRHTSGKLFNTAAVAVAAGYF